MGTISTPGKSSGGGLLWRIIIQPLSSYQRQQPQQHDRSSVVSFRLLVPLLATVLLIVTLVTLLLSDSMLLHLEQSHNPVMQHHLHSHQAFAAANNNNNNNGWSRRDIPTTAYRNVEEHLRRNRQLAPQLPVGVAPIDTVTYPNETAVPNPPLSDGNQTFSSCMLVMDDNHRLGEWLAYHYHVLPLRTMIVTVDPRSATSPTSVLNHWRQQGLYILEWNDRDFWRKDLRLEPIPDNASLQTKRDRHRGRQKYFYRRCLIHLAQLQRTWVTLHDSDEFLVYNHAGGEKYASWEAAMQRRHDQSVQHGHQRRIKPTMVPPTTAEEGAMLPYIRHEQAAGVKYYQSPCIGVPRLMFGADESTSKERQHGVPTGVDADIFDTTRFRKHAPRNDFVKNALGKVLIDVSRVDMPRTPLFMSLHRPMKDICAAPWHNDWHSGLRINHYLGSWESYSFRDDSRRGNERSREQWEYKATTNGDDVDDNIRPWLAGLVRTHGLAQAQHLLQPVGLPKHYRNSNTTRWHLFPDKLREILSSNETIAQDNKLVAFEDWVREKYQHEHHPDYDVAHAGGEPSE